MEQVRSLISKYISILISRLDTYHNSNILFNEYVFLLLDELLPKSIPYFTMELKKAKVIDFRVSVLLIHHMLTNCITCSTQLRNRLINMVLPVKVVINL
jgi:hypothetical protein